jgi:hypothetical protein
MQTTEEESEPRTKSTTIGRKSKADRKKFNGSMETKKVNKYTTRSAIKNKPKSIFSGKSGGDSIKQLTEVTTVES